MLYNNNNSNNNNNNSNSNKKEYNGYIKIKINNVVSSASDECETLGVS